MSKGVYAGALTEKPIYGEAQTLSLSLVNLDNFFTVSRHNETCKIFDVKRDDSPVGVIIEASDTTQSIQMITLTAKQTITNFYAECFYTGGSNTKVQFRVGDTYIIDGLTGTDMSGQKKWRGTLYEGDFVSFYFLNGTTSGYCAYLNCTCDPISYIPIVGYETVSVARKVNNFYVPAIGPVPIYGEVTHTNPALSSSNYTSYYFNTVTDLHDYGVTFASASHGGLRFKPKNIGTHSSEGGYGFVALYDLKNVKIYCKYTTETSYDKVSFWIGEEKILDAVSGTKTEAIVWEGDLPKDTLLDFFYTKDSSKHETGETVYWEIVCDPSTYTANEITGYTEGIAARKIKKGYVSINGIARTFFSFEQVKYTGNYTVEQITHNNQNYNLYTLTSSGTLTLNDPAEVWMCGAGGSGGSGQKYTYQTQNACSSGGGGGGGHVTSGSLSLGNYTITIAGSSSSNTTIVQNSTTLFEAAGGSSASTYGGAKGGSGGAGGYDFYASSANSTPSIHSSGGGSGDGISTYPFGIESLEAHCAGGNGGRCKYIDSSGSVVTSNTGKVGGSNGSNGTTTTGNASAVKGGGIGGTTSSGKAATFYGSGGGGGSFYLSSSATSITSGTGYAGGSGYQGVCYLLIPA